MKVKMKISWRGNIRPAISYRAQRRNAYFGRKPKGNTKPLEREAIYKLNAPGRWRL